MNRNVTKSSYRVGITTTYIIAWLSAHFSPGAPWWYVLIGVATWLGLDFLISWGTKIAMKWKAEGDAYKLSKKYETKR